MRRVILWIVAILITFAIGAGVDSLRRYLFTTEPPAAQKLETEPVAVAAPAVVTTSALEPAPKANLILDYNLEKFSRYGALYIMGPAPEGFRDFDCIRLALGTGGHVDYPGYISVDIGSDEYPLDSAPANFALVTERTLYFTTEPGKEQGFQYRFEGEFLVKDFNTVEGKNRGAVRGILTKSKNGRTLAEQTITFRVENMGC